MTDRMVDPARTSWVESANSAGCDFPIQNLPFGVYSFDAEPESGRVGVAIGDMILDVTSALDEGLIGDGAQGGAVACGSPRLNELMTLERSDVSALRMAVADLLDSGSDRGRKAIK